MSMCIPEIYITLSQTLPQSHNYSTLLGVFIGAGLSLITSYLIQRLNWKSQVARFVAEKIEPIYVLCNKLRGAYALDSGQLMAEKQLSGNLLPYFDYLQELRGLISLYFTNDKELNQLMKEIKDLDDEYMAEKLAVGHDQDRKHEHISNATRIAFKIWSWGDDSKISQLQKLLISRKNHLFKKGCVKS